MTESQPSLRKALQLTEGAESGLYYAEFPTSLCFGTVVFGGLTVTAASKAALDFVSKSPKTASHSHVWNVAVSFFRPTFPTPVKTVIHVRLANANKVWTTVHVEIKQNDKLCLAGYIMVTDLTNRGRFSLKTDWKLLPPAQPISVQALELDSDPNWVNWFLPIEKTNLIKAASYMKFCIPTHQQNPNTIDQWVTPAWKNEEEYQGNPSNAQTSSSNGAVVWTNELLQYVTDGSLPVLNTMLAHSQTPETPYYDIWVQAGLEQRRLRSQGKSDMVVGIGSADSDLPPVVVSTLTISTEVKKVLPPEGVKWLFLRAVTKSVVNDRMDYEVIVMDMEGDIVALSHHLILVSTLDKKQARKAKAVL